jgi:acetyl esterase
VPLSEQGRLALELMATSPAQQVGRGDLAEIRAALHAGAVGARTPPASGISFSDSIVASLSGPDVAVRIYRVADQEPDRPAVLFLHGGGWAICDVDTHHDVASQFAADTGCLVVSVGYRLAPEDPYPAAVRDCITAAHWVVDHAGELGASPRGIVVAGDSSGGNLAAAVALAARDGRSPRVLLQVLIYPVLDDDFTTKSWRAAGDGRFGLSERQMRWYWDQYAPAESDRSDPLAAPAKAADLAGLAPAFIAVGELDPLREDAERYAARLEDAGVPVDFRCYDGGFHGFYSFRGLLDIAGAAAGDVSAAVRAVHTEVTPGKQS